MDRASRKEAEIGSLSGERNAPVPEVLGRLHVVSLAAEVFVS
jgi:hypothetical protein